MVLTTDILNNLKRSVIENAPFELKLNNYVRFKGENLEMLVAYLWNCEEIKITTDKAGININTKAKIEENFDETTIKRARAQIWNYDMKRKYYNPEAEMLKKFMEDEDKEGEERYEELSEDKKTNIKVFSNFLDNKFEIDDSECFLMLVKEFDKADLDKDFVFKIARVMNQLDFVSIIPKYDTNGNDILGIRFLMGYEKGVK